MALWCIGSLSKSSFPRRFPHTDTFLCFQTASRVLGCKPQSFVFCRVFIFHLNWDRFVWLNVAIMNTAVCLCKPVWEREKERKRRWEVQHTMVSINLLSPPRSEFSHRCAGITHWHYAHNNIPSSATALQRLFQICSPHPAVCHWQGHRRLTSVLSGVAWGSWSAQLEIRQIYLDHEDKVVHLENDWDSVRPWCPLQLHRRVWPGHVYWTCLNPQPRCFDSSVR